MKLVMTLLARDEADIVDAQIRFHLNAGVDFVIATDNLSQDGTTQILESYAKAGQLHLIREDGEYLQQAEWITRMGRLAATEFGADWVIHSDADEFWWPRGDSLTDVLASIPSRYGIVRALLRHFVPRPDDGSPFAERMTVRMSTSAPINDPRSLFRPNLKIIHRADPNVNVSIGAQRLLDSTLVPLRGWYPIEFFHFPVRSLEQCERKYAHQQTGPGQTPSPYYDRVRALIDEGRLEEVYESLVVDDDALERGLQEASLVVDTRLRDALRALREGKQLTFPRPTVVDEAAYAIDVQVAFHLNAGVDFVIATDNNSRDGTTELLERYERHGVLRLIREPAEGLRQGEWVTRMARLAATKHGADWVINTDADEFWWPRGGSLKDVLAAVPEKYGIVQAFWRSFVPRPDDGAFFAERMTVRLTQYAPINDPTSFYRPVVKVAHRADPNVTVARGNHALADSPLRTLPTWHPIEVLHFPLRSRAQWMRKVELQGEAFTKHIDRSGTGYHLKGYDALRDGRIEQQHESLVVDDDALERGLAEGSLVLDTRLRDALRAVRGGKPLTFPTPTLADDAEYAVEAAALSEAYAVRAQRQLDGLEQRLHSLESR